MVQIDFRQGISLSNDRAIFVILLSILFFLSAPFGMAQSFQYQHLKTYFPQNDAFSIERVAYAPPYYAVAGRTQGEPEIRMFLYADGALSEAYRVHPKDKLPQIEADITSRIMANEYLTGIYYRGNDGSKTVAWFDQNQGEDAAMFSHLIQGATSISDIRLDGRNFYYLGNNDDAQVFGAIELDANLQGGFESAAPFEYFDIVTTQFGIADGEFLFRDQDGSDIDQVNGLARATLNSSRALNFVSDPFLPSFDRIIFLNIETYGPYVLLLNTEPPNDFTADEEIELYLWHRGEEPELLFAESIQNINFNAKFNGEMLVLSPRNYEETKLRLYQLSDGLFHPTASVPYVERQMVLGDELLIQYTRDNIVAHDLSDPSAPVEVEFPIEVSFVPTNVASSPGKAYLGNGESLWSIRTDDLENFEIVSKEDGITNANYQAPLLSKYNWAQLETAQFSYLLPEGEVLSEFNAPAIENTISYERYGEAMWNDHLFIQPVIVDETVPPNVNSDEYPYLYLYELNQDGLSDAAAASIKIPTKNAPMVLGDNEVYIAYTEIEFLDESPFFARNVRIAPFAITDDLQFEALPEFIVIDQGETLQLIKDLQYADGWLAAMIHDSIYLIDAKNPSHLKLASIFENNTDPPNYLHSMTWNQGRLFVSTYLEGIMVFDVTDEEALAHIGSVPYTNAYDFFISGDRMYILQRTGGVEVYEMQFDETPVPDWALY